MAEVSLKRLGVEAIDLFYQHRPAKRVFAVVAQKPWIVSIPGSCKVKRLDENLGAMAVQLTPEELAAMGAAMAKIEVVGDRYSAGIPRIFNGKVDA